LDIVDFLENKKLEEIAQQTLSNRELQTLRALSRGNDVAQIAKKLKISRNTVKVYMTNLSQKIAIPTTKTNFRVALCIFYNTFKQELEHGRN
jgi:DNA-binding NarL/FixJ family response regulator